MVSPGVAALVPSVFVVDRSACRSMVVTSVAWLLKGVGSIEPAGAVTVAEFDNGPGAADGSTVPEMVNVAVPDDVKVTSAAMLPLPEALVQLEPADAAQVHVAPSSSAGTASSTTASVIVEGPAFVTMSV